MVPLVAQKARVSGFHIFVAVAEQKDGKVMNDSKTVPWMFHGIGDPQETPAEFGALGTWSLSLATPKTVKHHEA